MTARKKREKREPSVWVLEKLDGGGAWDPSDHVATDDFALRFLHAVAAGESRLRISEYRRVRQARAKGKGKR